jgi:hypothetical protein
MNIQHTRSIAWFWIAALSLAAIPTWADGELDTSFGTNGIVKIPFPNAALGRLLDVTAVNGGVEAAGFAETAGATSLFIAQLSPSGAIVVPSSLYPLAVGAPKTLGIDSATGDVYVLGVTTGSNLHITVQRIGLSGAVMWTFTSPKTNCFENRSLIDTRGRLAAVCNTVLGPYQFQSVLLRVDAQGDPVKGTLFPLLTDPPVLTQDAASGAYYIVDTGVLGMIDRPCGSTSGGGVTQSVARLDADSGALDGSYGNGGAGLALCVDNGQPSGITVDSSGDVVIGGNGPDGGYLARLDPSGSSDPTFGSNGGVRGIGDAIADLRTDLSRRVYALGAGSSLMRFKADGGRDTSFSSPSIQALSGPNSQWHSLRIADSSESSAYLIGGSATTAVIAKVSLVSNSPPAGGGSGGSGGGSSGSGGGGGGGAFAGLELCAMLLLWLWRAFVSRYLEFGRDPSSTVPVAVGKGPRVLTAAGLAAGIVTSQTSSSVPSGDVISESPAAGSVVAPGSAVDLVVSSGTGGGGGGGSSGGSGSFTVIGLFLLLGAGLWCAWSNGRPADAPCGRRDVQRYSKLT